MKAILGRLPYYLLTLSALLPLLQGSSPCAVSGVVAGCGILLALAAAAIGRLNPMLEGKPVGEDWKRIGGIGVFCVIWNAVMVH